MHRMASWTRITPSSPAASSVFLAALLQAAAAGRFSDIDRLMNTGKFTFIIDIPPNFQRDVLAGHQPAIQLDVDATAMVQAGLGSGYGELIIINEVNDFVSARRRDAAAASQPRHPHRIQP